MPLKIVADENVHYQIIIKLREKGFNVISILENYKGADDKIILEIARNNNAILLTEDSDFGEWVFAYKAKSFGVIFLRYDGQQFIEMAKSLISLLNNYGQNLFQKFVVVTINKIRIREII